jgi:hypothetical protein
MLGIMYVETFKTDIIVFIDIKRHNLMLHWLTFSCMRGSPLILTISHDEIKGKMFNLPKIIDIFMFIPFSSTNKTDRQYITEILLKVGLNTITLTNNPIMNLPREKILNSFKKNYTSVTAQIAQLCYFEIYLSFLSCWYWRLFKILRVKMKAEFVRIH